MQTAAQGRPSTSAPGDGSRTLTITNDPILEDENGQDIEPEGGQAIGTLKLRARAKQRNTQRVAWDEGVVDNEGSGKKKSKICCIYHKPRRFDESSSEEVSDSEDEGHSCAHTGHNHQPHAGPSQQARPDGSGVVHSLESCEDGEPNAYERQPHNSGKRKAT